MLKLGLLLSGRGSNMQAIYRATQDGRLAAEVAVIISNKVDAAGLQFAREKGIMAQYIDPKSFTTKDEYENQIVAELQKQQVELVVLAGYMRIVGPVLLFAYPQRVVNIHPALLPSFPGLHGQKQALDYGVKVSGCTVHFVDAGMDTGPIILQSTVDVLDNDTEETLSARILAKEHDTYWRGIQLIAEGKLSLINRKVAKVA